MAASCCSEYSRHELQASFIDSYVSETSFFSGCSSRTSFFVESLKPLIRTSRLRTKSPIVWHFWYTWERNFPCDNMARLLVPYLTLYNNELGQPANKLAKVGNFFLPNTKIIPTKIAQDIMKFCQFGKTLLKRPSGTSQGLLSNLSRI